MDVKVQPPPSCYQHDVLHVSINNDDIEIKQEEGRRRLPGMGEPKRGEGSGRRRGKRKEGYLLLIAQL